MQILKHFKFLTCPLFSRKHDGRSNIYLFDAKQQIFLKYISPVNFSRAKTLFLKKIFSMTMLFAFTFVNRLVQYVVRVLSLAISKQNAKKLAIIPIPYNAKTT